MKWLPREIDSFWTLLTAPAVWAVHFLASYVGAAIYCAKPELFPVSFTTVRSLIAAATIAALGLIFVSALLAWRQWGFGSGDPPHDDPTRSDRVLFQGFATLLLSGLSFVAVVFTALPVLFISECAR